MITNSSQKFQDLQPENIITTSSYPIIEDIDFQNKALAFAIIKQESGLMTKPSAIKVLLVLCN